MRDRHLPRLCRSCHAPMARQEGSCWHCGAAWTAAATATPPAVASHDRERLARLDVDRWADEGGSSPFEGSKRVAVGSRS